MSEMFALLLIFIGCVSGEECNDFILFKTAHADITATPGISVSSKTECGISCINVINCSTFLYCNVAGDETCVVSPQNVSVNSMGLCDLYEKELGEELSSSSVSPPLSCENGGTLLGSGDCDCPSYTTGERCETRINDCQDAFNFISPTAGLYTVYPPDAMEAFDIQCDDTTNYGIVMMHRDTHSTGCTNVPVTYLDVGWDQYKQSFSEGNCYFWLGLEKIHALTSAKPYQLHIYVKNFNLDEATSSYSHFQVGDEASRYMMTAAGFSSDSSLIGDRFYLADPAMSFNGTNFCTDGNCVSNLACGEWSAGGWWYTDVCYANPHNQHGIEWLQGDGTQTTMKEMTMTLRPVASR